MITKLIKKIKLKALDRYKKSLKYDSGMIKHVGIDILLILVKKDLI